MKTKEHGINKAVQKFKVGLDLKKKKNNTGILSHLSRLCGGKTFKKLVIISLKSGALLYICLRST